MTRARLRHARRREQTSFMSTKNSTTTLTRARALFPQWAMNLFQPHRYKVVYGGRGAARSWSFARAILLICARKPTRVLCTREIQSSLKDSVHQLMRDQIELMFGAAQTQFIITDREIRHVNGSLILFAGLWNNVTKIKSIEAIDICWVEEAERVSKESWRTLIPTIRKTGSEIWVSFNPDQEEDATWQRLVVKKPPRSWVIKVNADQNPWFPDALREERDYDYSVDAEAADHIWGGNLRTHSDAQILRGKWLVQDFEVPTIPDPANEGRTIPQWDGPYQGMDFGFSTDPFAAVRCWIHNDILYIEHEAYGLGVEIDHAATYVTDRIPEFERYRTRADNARPDSISYLRRHGLRRLRPAKKGPRSVEDGIAYLRRFKRIVIHSRCKNARLEAKLYSYKVDVRSGDVLPVVVDKHNHLIDALRYALEPMMKKQMRMVFKGLDGVARPICRVCQSYLPDDGQCTHCGYNEHLDLNVADVHQDPTLLIPVPIGGDDDDSDDIADTADSMDTPIVPHANGNGHTNGNGNGNGHAPLPSRLAKFRGLNG